MFAIDPVLVAPQAVYLINKIVVPWKIKHSDKLARLAEQEQQAIIDSAKAVVLEKKAKLASDPSEIQQAKLEIERVRHGLKQMSMEIEEQRLKLQRQKIELVLEFLKSIDPDMSDEDKVKYTVRLLPTIENVISTLEPPR